MAFWCATRRRWLAVAFFAVVDCDALREHVVSWRRATPPTRAGLPPARAANEGTHHPRRRDSRPARIRSRDITHDTNPYHHRYVLARVTDCDLIADPDYIPPPATAAGKFVTVIVGLWTITFFGIWLAIIAVPLLGIQVIQVHARAGSLLRGRCCSVARARETPS